MAQIIYTKDALEDIERTFDFLAERDVNTASAAVTAIRNAIGILSDHPLIGRRLDEALRELIISFGKTGYVALYRFRSERNEVKILGIRHQRELDYPA